MKIILYYKIVILYNSHKEKKNLMDKISNIKWYKGKIFLIVDQDYTAYREYIKKNTIESREEQQLQDEMDIYVKQEWIKIMMLKEFDKEIK